MDKYQADNVDRRLHALFANEHIADNGFSVSVKRRVQRELRRRRWLISAACLAGCLLAVEPALLLAGKFGIFAVNLFSGFAVPEAFLPTMQSAYAAPLLSGLLVTLLAATRLLED